jgi:salicylate hydroxylase
MNTHPCIIVGGGIAGLATALGVAKADIKVTILEQAQEWSEAGAGIQIGPNAVHALRQLGAWETVEPITYSPPEIHIRNGKNGKLLQRVILGESFSQKFGAPYRVAHRADLHAALLQTTSAHSLIEIRNGMEVQHLFSQNGYSAIQTADGTSHETPCLFIADGVQSRLRELLFPATAAHLLPFLIQRSLVSLPKTTGIISFECINLWLFPGGHIVHYPVGKNKNINIVTVTDEASNQPAPPKAAELCSELASFMSSVETWSTWHCHHVPFLKSWHNGKACLVGDAAHGTVPFLAQGAAMALEDAACLAKLSKSLAQPATVFNEFQRQRQARTAKLDSASRAAARIYHASGIVATMRDLVLQNMQAQLTLNRLGWIYSHQTD